MQFKKFFISISTIIIWQFLLCYPVCASNILEEIDTIRAELSYIKDKNSPNYIKSKHKLEKLISKSKIDYSEYSRFQDIDRLYTQHKYQTALYELNELIAIGYEVSKCNEYKADIYFKTNKPPRTIAKYYKIAVQEDKGNTSAKYKLAKLYLNNKKNIIAIEYLKQTISDTQNQILLEEIAKIIQNNITPKNRYEANNLYEILGDIYIKLNRKNLAYDSYIKALKLNPKDIFLKYLLAGELYKDNENIATIQVINSIIYENPKDTQIRTTKAKSLLKMGEYKEAEQEYREILSINPYSTQAKYGIYEIYKNTLKPDDIIKKIYNKPNSANITKEELTNFANFLREMEDIEGMQTFSQYVYEINKKEVEMLLKKKKEIERQENIHKQQELLKQKQAQLEEENKQRQAQLEQENKRKQALLKEEKRKQEQAKIKKAQEKKEIKNAQTTKKETTSIKKPQEKKLTKKENNTQITTNDKKIIELEIKKSKAKNAKKYQDLKTTIEKYLKLEPKNAEIYLAIANTYKQMEVPTLALSYYNKAKQLAPTNSDIYYNIGLTKLEKNDTEGAKSNLVKSLQLNPENEKTKNLLRFVNQKIITHKLNESYSKYEKKEYIEAFEILDKAIKDYPNNYQIYYYRALIYEAMNRNAAAIIDLQKTIELNPAHYMAYYKLGYVYEKIKDERSALVAYEKFLSIEPDEKDLINEIQKKVIILGAKYY